jgi:hypothetical protein
MSNSADKADNIENINITDAHLNTCLSNISILFTSNTKSIIISDASKETIKKGVYSTLVIKRDTIELTEHEDKIQKKSTYLFSSKSLYIDKQKMDRQDFAEFFNQVQSLGRKLQEKQAKLYHETSQSSGRRK